MPPYVVPLVALLGIALVVAPPAVLVWAFGAGREPTRDDLWIALTAVLAGVGVIVFGLPAVAAA